MLPAINLPLHPLPSGGRPGFRLRPAAFTLVELLVSMTILSLMLVLTAQMVNQTTVVTTASSKQMDVASMGRIVLDRFGNDFATALLTNGATALYYTPMTGTAPDPTGNSAIGFLSQTRARDIGTSSATGKLIHDDIRGATVGYKIRDLSFPYGSDPKKPLVDLPVLQRGDGRFTFSTKSKSGTNCASFAIDEIFGTKELNIPNDISTTNDEHILNWQGVGDGILRFHVSFVLDDGTTVQSLRQGTAPKWTRNATYQNFNAANGPGITLPIAFTANASADDPAQHSSSPGKRYVKGLIVGLAVLDEATFRLAYGVDNAFPAKLAQQLSRPTQDGETPVGVWQKNLTNVAFLPVRQNLRFYQRFYPVNM